MKSVEALRSKSSASRDSIVLGKEIKVKGDEQLNRSAYRPFSLSRG